MAEYVRTTVQSVAPKSFVMIKNYRGALGVKVDPYDFSAPAREIHFTWDQDSQHVPTKWALGVFVTQQALKTMEQGVFTFENLDLLIRMAEEAGLYVPDSIKEPKILIKDIKEILLKNNLPELKKLMLNASKKTIQNLINESKKILPKLNTEIVNYIENAYKISLSPIQLDE